MHRLQKKVLTYLARCSISKSPSSILWFLCVDKERDREKDREREEKSARISWTKYAIIFMYSLSGFVSLGSRRS